MVPLFPETTERWLAVIAGVLISVAQFILLRDVWRRKMSPAMLSWIGWALLMGTSLVSQIIAKGWAWSLVGLSISTFGCVCIFSLSWIRKSYLIGKMDWWFLILGIICFAIYLASKDPWMTTGFALLADVIIGIPTIHKAYLYPLTQKTIGWTIALGSWSITLLICIGHNWLYDLFPIYLFLYNGIMFMLTHRSRIAVPLAVNE